MIGLSGLDPKHNQTVALYEHHGFRPNFVHETKQVSSVRQMVRSGLCSSVQPRQSMENDPDIITVPIEESEKIYLRIIWNKDIRHKKAFNDFIAFARKYFEVK